jgi:hypothetical protein
MTGAWARNDRAPDSTPPHQCRHGPALELPLLVAGSRNAMRNAKRTGGWYPGARSACVSCPRRRRTTNHFAATPNASARPSIPDVTDSPLTGRAYLLARVGWVVLTLLVLTLNTLALPHAYVLLQTVCHQGSVCINGLTPSDLRELHHLGLTPGFLVVYQLGWDVGTTLFYTALAALIFWRRSADRMALFCAYMLVLFGGATYTGLLDLGLRTVDPVRFWLVGALELLAQVSVPTFFLLFPSGRFVPRWTRWGVLVFAFYEGWYVYFTSAYMGKFSGLSSGVFGALLLGVVGLQIYRFRRASNYRERQQTKWVVFGLTVGLGGFALLLLIGQIFFSSDLHTSRVGEVLFATTVTYGLLLLVPISIAIAILRSRLYDIDAIINLALVYGLLTGILGALYAGIIIGLASVAGTATGQASSNQLALIISTLVIAALVQPLRRRLQHIIGRRFYRREYDAAKTLAAFSASLRNEVDLEQLREHLLAVVRETMQPV